MRCPRCQADNRDGRRFCRACGTGLQVLCERCGFENLPSDRFCGGCGAGQVTSVAAANPEDLPDSDLGGLPDDGPVFLAALAHDANRLQALRMELPMAHSEAADRLSDLDISDLDDQFIEGEA